MHTTYIVHVEQPESREFLASSRGFKEMPRNLLVQYHLRLRPDAADLTAEEAIEMQSKDGVLDVRPDEFYQLETTYTLELLGLRDSHGGAWWDGTYQGEGIVIGVLGTGILPTHPSFNDYGMPPPLVTWKGSCSNTNDVACNNKIIGAKAFNSRTVSTAIDTGGHGTHMAAIAAGNFVRHSNVLGTGNGTLLSYGKRYAHAHGNFTNAKS